ncbi:MAG: Hsp20/alpha crystallin family protein [Flavobacteriales bacterium]|nr:Hsp20/alpha crystallin family protein [Flavobacteriales bacterium]
MLSTLNPIKSDFLTVHNFLQNELKHIFEPEIRMGSLPVNILETDDRFLIELVAPGFQKSEFSIELEKQLLTIRAERQEEKQDQTSKFHTRQFIAHSFTRSFRIPESVDEDKISASYDAGVLMVTLPKKKNESSDTKKLIGVQ